MSIIQADCSVIKLSGIIFSSSLTLTNPNQLLAVVFELESKPSFLQIEPSRGMILQGDRKFIKLRCKTQLRPILQQLQKRDNLLIIRASYFCEYNKKLMAANGMRGWSVISKEIQEMVLPIYFNVAEELKKIRKSPQRDSSLNHSRKTNSFEKFRDSSIKRIKNQKLNEDLDFIFRNEEFKKKYQEKHSHKPQYRQDRPTYTTPEFYNKMRKEEQIQKQQKLNRKQPNQIVNIKSSTPADMGKKNLKGDKVFTKRSRSFELIILAILAALFVSLGQGIGGVFKY